MMGDNEENYRAALWEIARRKLEADNINPGGQARKGWWAAWKDVQEVLDEHGLTLANLTRGPGRDGCARPAQVVGPVVDDE